MYNALVMRGQRFHRRDVLRLGGLAFVAGSLGKFTPRTQAQVTSRYSSQWIPEDLRVELRMRSNATAQVRSGALTHVWKYEGTVLDGPASALTPGPGYLGPTFRVMQGQRLTVHMANYLPEPTITHWHGLDVPSHVDGHPFDAVASGLQYDYEFTVENRAGTYWYHPHPDMMTGSQVARGLAGLFIVSDPQEQRLALPRGDCDIPIVIQDRRINASNQFTYVAGGLPGFLGTSLVVNGQENLQVPCSTRCYRLRILNGSNARMYKLVFDDGTPLVVIGSDGGLLERPVVKPYVMLAPGERVELWVDWRFKSVGSVIRLRSLGFNPTLGTTFALPHGGVFDVCSFAVTYPSQESLIAPPAVLSRIPRYRLEHAINASNPRRWDVSFDDVHGHFLLNGQMFDMLGTLPNEIVRADTLEVIEFHNPATFPSMPHPIHLHGRQFQVLDRTLIDGNAADYQQVRAGFLDEGWKDTFILWPGERVRILLRYTRHPGLYVYHCHILEHEDMDMMRNFRVIP